MKDSPGSFFGKEQEVIEINEFLTYVVLLKDEKEDVETNAFLENDELANPASSSK